MNANELHDLVNGPFTMPDGSKRRALWERVPATRPMREYFSEGTRPLVYVDIPPGRGEFCWEEIERGWVVIQYATALVRVGIEDWLLRQKKRLLLSSDGHGSTVFEYGGPTLLHALVAAAHARADALGVPH